MLVAYTDIPKDLRAQAEPGGLIPPSPTDFITATTILTNFQGEPMKVEALVDTASFASLIDPMIAAECGLKVKPAPHIRARAINGAPLDVIGTTESNVTITDLTGQQQSDLVQFVVTNAA